MEQAALVDDESVRHGVDRADLLEEPIRVQDIAAVGREFGGFALGRGDKLSYIGLGHPLDAGRTLSLEGSAAALRHTQIVKQGVLFQIGRIEKRRPLRP